jgi:hypothetical protein
MYDPDNTKYRESLQNFSISQSREFLDLRKDEQYFNAYQYERHLLNDLNSEEYDLQGKIKLLSKGVIYLNTPPLYYLWVHYNFEN